MSTKPPIRPSPPPNPIQRPRPWGPYRPPAIKRGVVLAAALLAGCATAPRPAPKMDAATFDSSAFPLEADATMDVTESGP